MKRLEEIKKAFSSKYRPYAISDTEIQLVNMGWELIAEVERLRPIEDCADRVTACKADVGELACLMRDNPRPED